MQELAVRLNRPDHAGHDAGTVAERWSAVQQKSDFRLDTSPDAVSELSQQTPVEAGRLRSKRACSLSRLGIVSTTCRCATGAQTSLVTWMAVSNDHVETIVDRFSASDRIE